MGIHRWGRHGGVCEGGGACVWVGGLDEDGNPQVGQARLCV